MRQAPGQHDPTPFLERVGQEAADWPLRVLTLPGGLVLLQQGLSGRQRQHFLLHLSQAITAAESEATGQLATAAWAGGDRAGDKTGAVAGAHRTSDHDRVHDRGHNRENAPSGAGPEAAESGAAESENVPTFCQVTVEERRQLFSCFQVDSQGEF